MQIFNIFKDFFAHLDKATIKPSCCELIFPPKASFS